MNSPKSKLLLLSVAASSLLTVLFSCSLAAYRPLVNVTVGIPAGAARSPGLTSLSCFLVAAESNPPFTSRVNLDHYDGSCLGMGQYVAERTYTYAEILAGASLLLELRSSTTFRVFGVETASGSCAAKVSDTLNVSPRPKLYDVGTVSGVNLSSQTLVHIPSTYSTSASNRFGECLKLSVFTGNAGIPASTPALYPADGAIPPKSYGGGTMPTLLGSYVDKTFLLSHNTSTDLHQRIDFVHFLGAITDLDGFTSLTVKLPYVYGGLAGPTVSPDCYRTEFAPVRNAIQGFFHRGGLGPGWTSPSQVGTGEGGVQYSLTPLDIRDLMTTATGTTHPYGILFSAVANVPSDSTHCSGISFSAPVQFLLN